MHMYLYNAQFWFIMIFKLHRFLVTFRKAIQEGDSEVSSIKSP